MDDVLACPPFQNQTNDSVIASIFARPPAVCAGSIIRASAGPNPFPALPSRIADLAHMRLASRLLGRRFSLCPNETRQLLTEQITRYQRGYRAFCFFRTRSIQSSGEPT